MSSSPPLSSLPAPIASSSLFSRLRRASSTIFDYSSSKETKEIKRRRSESASGSISGSRKLFKSQKFTNGEYHIRFTRQEKLISLQQNHQHQFWISKFNQNPSLLPLYHHQDHFERIIYQLPARLSHSAISLQLLAFSPTKLNSFEELFDPFRSIQNPEERELNRSLYPNYRFN